MWGSSCKLNVPPPPSAPHPCGEGEAEGRKERLQGHRGQLARFWEDHKVFLAGGAAGDAAARRHAWPAILSLRGPQWRELLIGNPRPAAA